MQKLKHAGLREQNHLFLAQVFRHHAPHQPPIYLRVRRRRMHSSVALELRQRHGMEREQLALQLRRIHRAELGIITLHLECECRNEWAHLNHSDSHNRAYHIETNAYGFNEMHHVAVEPFLN